MIDIEQSIVITRPTEEVFAFMTDVEKLSQWMSELVEAKQSSDGPMDVGTTISAVAKPLGRQVESTLEVVEFESNRRFALKSISGPVTNEDTFTFEPVTDGTKVTRATKGEIGGFFKLAEPLVDRMLRRQFETNLANLKDLLEAQA